MPVESFFEHGPGPKHVKTGTNGDYIRYRKLMAQVAPYIGTESGKPTLGWKSPSLATQVQYTLPIYGQLRAFLPNAK